ncbi:monothiol glutaredoxin-S2-like [Salvia divinorum]|uniref:Monothiol glutaredoxin-S2-like n=1 Tax=Salvia divinorum TaxID=28513 RepID=A0ABD1IMP6_SALDI
MDTIAKLGSENPVVIFSKSNCCMSHAIDTLIRGYGANPRVYELDQLAEGDQMEKDLMALGCNPSVPAVFINKEFVGGSNEIISLNVRGKLKPLLIKANAIWV